MATAFSIRLWGPRAGIVHCPSTEPCVLPSVYFPYEYILDLFYSRQATSGKMNSNIRAELRRQIDDRYAKKAAQYDYVTGTSSSIATTKAERRGRQDSEKGM